MHQTKQSKADKLNAILSKKKTSKKNQFADDVLGTMKRELSVLVRTGVRPKCLNQVYHALLSLPPSSTEAERTFSTTGFFVNKLRSSLSDDTIDMLIFVRSYLKYKNL